MKRTLVKSSQIREELWDWLRLLKDLCSWANTWGWKPREKKNLSWDNLLQGFIIHIYYYKCEIIYSYIQLVRHSYFCLWQLSFQWISIVSSPPAFNCCDEPGSVYLTTFSLILERWCSAPLKLPLFQPRKSLSLPSSNFILLNWQKNNGFNSSVVVFRAPILYSKAIFSRIWKPDNWENQK